MGSNAKLLLVALCGAVIASVSVHVHASKVEVAAYRGGAVGASAASSQLFGGAQQQPSAAQAGIAAGRMQPVKVLAAAYRDSEYLRHIQLSKATVL